MSDLTIYDGGNSLSAFTADTLDFIPDDASPAVQSRLTIFTEYLTHSGGHILRPDLRGFAAYLRDKRGLTPSSINAYLSTVRGRYRTAVLQSNEVDALIMQNARAAGHTSLADQHAAVERVKGYIENELASVSVSTPSHTVKTDAERGRWLSADEVDALLSTPDTDTLTGLRDHTIFAVMLHTGLRRAELCNLRVRDVYGESTSADGVTVPVLKVTAGKGGKQRLIPYGRNAGRVLGVVRRWQTRAGVESGFVFTGLSAAGSAKDEPEAGDLRDTRMQPRNVNYIFDRYPIGGRPVSPHDLRRTYAGRLYNAGVKLPDIQRLLGHADYNTTLIYLGLEQQTVDVPELW